MPHIARISPLRLRADITLARWQEQAVQLWRQSRHATRGPRHGIIEAVTGTGKSIAAMACMVDASQEVPTLRFAVVVPSQNLAKQWHSQLCERLGLRDNEIGLRMTGHTRASLRTHQIVIWVIDTARNKLADDCKNLDVMLVVDECHRSGSTQNRKIYNAKTRFRLGLSATAERPGEVDDNGILVPLDRQYHALQLGPTLLKISFSKAEEMGILPPFRLVHHGLELSPEELIGYRNRTRAVSEAHKAASELGLEGGAVTAALSGRGRYSAAQIAAALDVQRAVLARKQFLYLRPERARVAALLVAEAFSNGSVDPQALLFHERIAATARDLADDDSVDDDHDAPTQEQSDNEASGADDLYKELCTLAEDGHLHLDTTPEVAIRLHHSRHPDPEAFNAMRRQPGDPQRAQVLVSVKSAVEGVDLPGADVGIVVASSSAVRQRIQTLGRILRPLRDSQGRPMPACAYHGLPPRTLHLLYMHGTVDDEIYKKTDWDEMLGRDHNFFYRWQYGAEIPSADDAPPEPPLSDKEAAIKASAALAQSNGMPVPWLGRRPRDQAQDLKYTGNAIRKRRGSPPIVGGERIMQIVDAAAALLKVPSTTLRGSLIVRLADGLVIRATPQHLKPIARQAQISTTRWLVLGQLIGQLGKRHIPPTQLT